MASTTSALPAVCPNKRHIFTHSGHQCMRSRVNARRVSSSRPYTSDRRVAPIRAVGSEIDATPRATEWFQKSIRLPEYPRGCHVITRKVLEQLPELRDFGIGVANIFILHTSASLTINENASPDVPLDLNDSLDRIVPEGNMYRHLDEGYDDMPAHVKSSLMGPSLTIPISGGTFALGTWQGIYLNEHRDYGGPRRLVVTIQGQKRRT